MTAIFAPGWVQENHPAAEVPALQRRFWEGVQQVTVTAGLVGLFPTLGGASGGVPLPSPASPLPCPWHLGQVWPSRAPPQALPLASSFCLGAGRRRWLQGAPLPPPQEQQAGGWNNMSCQEEVPQGLPLRVQVLCALINAAAPAALPPCPPLLPSLL